MSGPKSFDAPSNFGLFEQHGDDDNVMRPGAGTYCIRISMAEVFFLPYIFSSWDLPHLLGQMKVEQNLS